MLMNLDYYKPEFPADEKDLAPDWHLGGTFTLQAQMGSGTHRKNHWEAQGTATSNKLEIHIPAP